MLPFVGLRRVDNERRHQGPSRTGSVDRHVTERGLEVVDPRKGEPGKPHVVRRSEHHDPSKVIHFFE